MRFSKRTGVIGGMCFALAAPAFSAVVGTNTPAPEVSLARLAELPAAQRAAWADYIARSQKQERFDRDSLAAELQPGQIPPPPPVAGSGKMPLTKDAGWYASAEARAIADTIVSFQTPSGGWSKNQDRTKPPRLRGQRFANDAETMQLNTGSFDAPRDRFWTFVGSLDNGATTTEMRFLGRVQAQLPGKDGDAYRASIARAVKYLLMAQYPNGGWPQNYPLEGGFHDGITFNDNAVAEAAMILEDIAEGHADFAFVAKDLREQAGAASARAIKPILDAQVVVDGKKTVWPQQVDALTLQPISARNYEMRSLASAESSEVLLFLMRQPKQTPEIKAAVDAGIAWLKEHAIYGKAFTKVSDEEGRKLVDKPGAGPIWSRNYDIKTGKPIFGDWDKSVQDDVNNISKGRRNGYSWYNSAPQKAIDAHAKAASDIAIAAPRGLSGAFVQAETFGAKGDGVTMDTAALQKAIDTTAVRKATLVLKPGTYLTGSLFLKSGMALRLDKGVKLVGAQDIKAYPLMPTRIAGIELSWPSALLNVYEQSDVKIYGEGAIDGNGKVFWDRFQSIRYDYEARGLRWAADYDAQRPRLIQIYNSSRIELGNGPQGEPLQLMRSGFWTVQVVYSQDVKVSGISVRNNIDGKGPSTDGVDIDSSHTVLVENADIDANDDALCLKAGRDADGLRVNRPTENVVIRNSTVRSAYAGVTFGSETSGGIRKVRVHNLKVVGPVRYGILFKSAATRGGGASDIDIHDIAVEQAETGIRINLNWFPAYSYAKIPDNVKNAPAYWKTLTAQVPRDKGLPQVRDIRISRVTAKGLKTAVELEAYADAPLQNIHIDDVDLEAEAVGSIRHARNVQITRSRIAGRNGQPVTLENAENIQIAAAP